MLAACAHRPELVAHMDATRIQEISDYRLCDAVANLLNERGQRYPVIDNEIERRGISCEAFIAYVVSDCSMLRITNIDSDSSPQGTIFTVASRASEPRQFRIYYQGIQSSNFVIEGGATRSFGVAIDPGTAAIGRSLAAAQGAGGAELNECRIVLDRLPPPIYRRGAPRPAAAAPHSSQPRSGVAAAGPVQSRALRNANVRAGPGTNFAVVRTLRAGETVTVTEVIGSWCAIAAPTRSFVSCTLLAPPPGGWAQAVRPRPAPGQGGSG